MTLSLITDRRQADVGYLLSLIATGWSEMTTAEQTAFDTQLKGAYNYTDFNRVESAVAYLIPIFADAGYVISLTTKTNWAIDDYVTLAEATRYLYNITQIRNVFTYLITTPPSPASLAALSYVSANNIEQILLDAEMLIGKLVAAFFYSNELYLGETF